MAAERKNRDWYVLLVSIAVVVYFFFIVTPYGERHGFFSEASPPPDDKVLPYFLMTTPVLAGYLVFGIMNIRRIAFLRWVNYPLMIFNLYVFAFFCASAITGGTVFWLILLTGLVPLVLIPAALVFGLIKDIKYLRKRRRP